MVFNKNRIEELERKLRKIEIEHSYFKSLLQENNIDIEENRYKDVTPKKVMVEGKIRKIKRYCIGINGEARDCNLILDRMTGIVKPVYKC